MKRFPKALLGLVLAVGIPAFHAAAAENNYIAVIGSGKAEQWPDYAVVTASVEAVEETTKEAVTKTTKTLLALAEGLKKTGIPDEQIEFIEPSVTRKADSVRQPGGEYKYVILGFEANQSIKVTINDLNRTGEVITSLTNGGAEISGGVSFEIKDPGDLHARARSLAISNARKKAKDYAADSGRKLGRLLIVEESMIGQYRLFPNLKELVSGTRDHLYSRNEASAPQYVPVTPQPVSVIATLYVKYALQ